MQVRRLAGWQAEGHAPHQVVRPLPARPRRGNPAGLVCAGLAQPVQGSLGQLAEEWCAWITYCKTWTLHNTCALLPTTDCCFQERSSSNKEEVAAATAPAMLQGPS